MSFLKRKNIKEVELTEEQRLEAQIAKTHREAHGTPISRREMLAGGVIPFAATITMPSWLKVFANAGVAQAEDLVCASASGGNLPAFVQIKLNGGMAMGYNFIANAPGGVLPTSLAKYGGGTASNVQLVQNFKNNAQFYVGSGFQQGVATTATLTTLSKTVFAGVPCVIGDDSSTQKLGLLGAVNDAGLRGNLIQSIGTADTITGLPANPAITAGLEAPLNITRLEDVLGSLGVSGALSTLTSAQKAKLFNTIQTLTAGQVAAIQGLNGADALSRLMQCANISNSTLIGNSGQLNISPLTDANFATLWGITANTATNNQNFVFATQVQNAINGNCGPVGMSIGGYDYHGNPKADTDAKDMAAGVLVGKILESFALKQKPGFIVVCSDGAVSSMESNTPGQPWASDGGGTSCIYMMYYDPIPPLASSFQVGQMTAGGRADDSFVTGGDPEKAAAAVLYNYLRVAYGSVAGDAKFSQVASSISFSTTQKDAISIFSKAS